MMTTLWRMVLIALHGCTLQQNATCTAEPGIRISLVDVTSIDGQESEEWTRWESAGYIEVDDSGNGVLYGYDGELVRFQRVSP